MNGRYLFDTNAVIALLRGDGSLLTLSQSANWMGISVVTYLEFLSFPKLSPKDENLFKQFASRVSVVSLDLQSPTLIQEILTIRRTLSLKLPDAIIAATAIQQQASLVTADQDFSKVPQLSLHLF
jgi:tRNA(fMet)-specific endonuclease VapC